MDAAEHENRQNSQSPGITININAPDNRIAARDYVEVHIHLNGCPDDGRECEEEQATQGEEQDRSVAAEVAEFS